MQKFLNPFCKMIPELQIDQFRTRLAARFFIMLIFMTEAIERFYFIYIKNGVFDSSSPSHISFPFLFGLMLIIFVEAVLYKRMGSKVLKYTKIVDGIFFLFFTIEWLSSWWVSLERLRTSAQTYISFAALLSFSSISWRTLIQIFIVKHWFLRIVAPVCGHALLMTAALSKTPDEIAFILVKGISQILYVIAIFYWESKMSLRLLLTNVEQEKWVQINKFILDNIPENIAIFNIEGETTYINEYFKQFIKQCHCSQDMNQFLKEVKSLERHYEQEPMDPEVLEQVYIQRRRSSQMSDQETDRKRNIYDHFDSLETLIKDFQTIVTYNSIGEKFFMVFNGKLKLIGQQEKSIEVKLSFVTQSSKQYIILILRDTTQRDILLNLESNNKYKDRLLASVSHELRTPLNGTINFVEASIKERNVSEDIKQKYLEPALKSSKFLLHLINDILDMSQITAQKLRLTFQYSNLKETFLNSLQLVEIQAKKKGIRLEASLDPLLPNTYCTDHMRLSQIILNLLNNSIKFTQEGFIKLIVSPIKGSSLIQVSVEDSGIGIEKENIEKLFSDYGRLEFENRPLLNPNGVGLGLSISFRLAELLGPKGNNGITVVSIPNEGSTFSFLLENKDMIPQVQTITDDWTHLSDHIEPETEPCLDSRALSQISTKLMKKPSGFGYRVSHSGLCECPKILIVDDNTFNIMAFESILTIFNIKSDCAYSGRKALEKINKRLNFPCGDHCKPYEMVFMDQEMPDMDGTETVLEIANLRKDNLLGTMKVVGCTAHSDEGEEMTRFLKSGIDECIFKPISPTVIQKLLEKYKLY